MEFRHVEAFVCVAERESFTRAGDQMHLSQSAVSQLIRGLEAELGEPLFVRNGRSVCLTPTGAKLLPAAMDLLARRQAFAGVAPPRPEDVTGDLRVGTSAAAPSFLWVRMFEAFAATYPNVNLTVRATSQTQTTVEAILAGELDAGFLPFPLPDPRLGGQLLGHQEAMLLAAPDHPLATGGPVSIGALGAAPFILYERRMNFRALAERFFRVLGIAPRVVLQSNDTNFIRAMTEAGAGVAFLPNWAVQKELAAGRLTVLDVSGPRLYEEFGTIYLKRGICVAAQEFVRFCVAHPELMPECSRGVLPQP